MRTIVVTLIGPQRTADVVVDADAPVLELIPQLLGQVGELDRDHLSEWTVAVMGKEPLAPELTLEQLEVLDGAVLVLRRGQLATVARPEHAVPSGPGGSPLARARERIAGWSSLEAAVAEARLVRCPTIAVASPKGGVGKTTLSIILGELLAGLREEAVIALDADSDYGSLARVTPVLDGGSGQARRDAHVFEALAAGTITFADLDRALWTLPGGLRAVPSPRAAAAMAKTDRATYARVIGQLQRMAGILILDCGTGLGQPGVQASVLACDQLVLVTDPTGATASLLVEAAELLERAGRPITIVCNRLRRGREHGDLARIDALFPRASALVGVPDEQAAELALRGELDLARAPQPLLEAARTLGAVLALEWPSLGLTRET